MLLRIEHLSVSYGAVRAVRDFSMSVDQGEIVTVLGANGAGKTSLLRTISGLVRPREGSIELDGRNIAGLAPHLVARAGIAHVPEGRGVLQTMTVLENLRLGAFCRRDKAVEQDLAELMERFPILAERRDSPASLLSGGQQQIVALARAWMARPRLILLDEPSMGLAPRLVLDIFEMIAAARQRSAVLLVEQNTRAALNLASRGYVMQLGQLVKEGSAHMLLSDQGLIEAYLGGDRARKEATR